MLMESRIRREVYVRFGGEHRETYCSNTTRRLVLSPTHQPGQYHGARLFRHGDATHVCRGGYPGTDRCCEGLSTLGLSSRGGRTGCCWLVWLLYFPGGSVDSDPLIFWVVKITCDADYLHDQPGRGQAYRIQRTESTIYPLCWGRIGGRHPSLCHPLHLPGKLMGLRTNKFRIGRGQHNLPV